MKVSRTFWIVLGVVVFVVAVGGFYFTLQDSRPDLTTPLEGKKVSELMKMNTPIECNVTLLETVRVERNPDETTKVPTFLYLWGKKVREEGISIFSDGNEVKTLNIADSAKSELYSLLLDESGKMAHLDFGAIDVITSYDKIPPTNLECKRASFGKEVFTPQNVCYYDKAPSCISP